MVTYRISDIINRIPGLDPGPTHGAAGQDAAAGSLDLRRALRSKSGFVYNFWKRAALPRSSAPVGHTFIRISAHHLRPCPTSPHNESPDEDPGSHRRSAQHKPVARSAQICGAFWQCFALNSCKSLIDCTACPVQRGYFPSGRVRGGIQNACDLPDLSAPRYRLVPRLWDPGSSSGDSIGWCLEWYIKVCLWAPGQAWGFANSVG